MGWHCWMWSPLRMRPTPHCMVNELLTRMTVTMIGSHWGLMKSVPCGGHVAAVDLTLK